MIVKPHMMTRFVGSQGKPPESAARRTNPPSAVGTTKAFTRIVGVPNRAVRAMVRRGRDGIRAARMASSIAIPPSCISEM
jgi:hypothetical protein